MSFWFDFPINLFNPTIWVDRESRSSNSHKFFSHKFFESVTAVGGSNFGVRVAQQGKGQLIFSCKLGVRLGPVCADAEGLQYCATRSLSEYRESRKLLWYSLGYCPEDKSKVQLAALENLQG